MPCRWLLCYQSRQPLCPRLDLRPAAGVTTGKRIGRANGCSRDGAFKWRKRGYLATYSVCLDQPFIAGVIQAI